MKETMTAKEAAELLDITERRVTALCKEGRIKGACKSGRLWQIPLEADKPIDSRSRTGAYRRSKLWKAG